MKAILKTDNKECTCSECGKGVSLDFHWCPYCSAEFYLQNNDFAQEEATEWLREHLHNEKLSFHVAYNVCTKNYYELGIYVYDLHKKDKFFCIMLGADMSRLSLKEFERKEEEE